MCIKAVIRQSLNMNLRSDRLSLDEELTRRQISSEIRLRSCYSISHAGNAVAKYKVELAPSLRARMYVPGTVKSHVDLYPAYNPEIIELSFEEGLTVRIHTRPLRHRTHEPLMYSPTGCTPTIPRSPPRSPPPPTAPIPVPSRPSSPPPPPPRCPTPIPQSDFLDRAGIGRGAQKRTYDEISKRYIKNSRRCTLVPKRNPSLDSLDEILQNRASLSDALENAMNDSESTGATSVKTEV